MNAKNLRAFITTDVETEAVRLQLALPRQILAWMGSDFDVRRNGFVMQFVEDAVEKRYEFA